MVMRRLRTISTATGKKVSPRVKAARTRREAVKEGFRSAFEQQLAESFKCQYEYETEVLEWQYNKVKKYTPDFILIKKDGSKMYIEAKGRFFSQDRTKMKEIRKQHPDKDIRIIFLDGTTKLSKTSNTTYMEWAKRNGFKAHDCKRGKPTLPLEWEKELK